MKRLILIVISLCITMIMQAQVYKTLIVTAGGLSTALTPTELSTVTNLTLTGTIDERDFITMRDNMPVLAVIDISGATIAAYSDTPANEVPGYAFKNPNTGGVSKISLTSITLPTTATSIGKHTFHDCTGLTSVIIPSSITSIGQSSFQGCTGLTSLNLPSSLILIGWAAFYNCSGLTSINIPNSVKYIGDYAFYNCSSLETIYLDVTTPIDLNSTARVFYNVNKTTCILYIPYGTMAPYTTPDAYPWNTFNKIVELPGFILSSSDINFASANSTDSVTIASNVTWTASSDQSWLTLSPISFTGNNTLFLTVQTNSSVATRTAIISITSPGVITRMIKVNQVGVSKILEVTAGGLFSTLTTFERNTITKLILTGTIDARDFKTMRDEMTVLAELDLSGSSIAAYSGAEGTYLNSYNYLVNEVPDYAFYNSVTNIPKISLTSVILPSSSVTIGNYAFGRCTGLTSVTISSWVTSIGKLAFWNCSGITSFVIPSSVTSIGASTFYGCSGLTAIIIPPSVISIGNGVFTECSGLTSVTIPSSVTSIGAGAFSRCTGLTSVTIPSSVTSIGGSAFSGCTGLTSIDIPLSVTDIGINAFYSCRGLVSINIPSSVKSIGASTFYGCEGLTSINIPSSVTSIGNYAFQSCTSLTTLAIPSSVTTIGSGAFRFIDHLKSIYAYGVTPVDLSSSPEVFLYDNNTTCILYVPYGTSALYRAANQWKDFLNIVEMSAPALSLSTYAINMASTSSTALVTITSNVTWVAISSQSWLTVNPTSFTGNSTLTLTAEANPSDASRTAEVTVSSPGLDSQTITISQVGLPKTLEISATSINMASTSSTNSVTITSNVTWSAVSNQSWLTVNPTSFTGNSTLTLTAEANLSEDSRTAEVTVSSPGLVSQTITISQVGLPKTLEVSATSINMTSIGSTDLVTITSNVIWSASSDQNWLTVSPTSFTGNSTLTLTAEANLSVATRIALVTISSPGLDSQTITISQIGLPKTLEVTAGGLFQALTVDERNTITRLSITGTIDARDFKTMRDEMPLLAELDLSGATVAAYNGTEGTYDFNYDYPYPANEVPDYAFCKYLPLPRVGKTSLTSVILPSLITTTGSAAFQNCTRLTSVAIPSTVTTIGASAFSGCTSLNSIILPSNVIYISGNAFYACSSLTSLIIPSSVKVIAGFSFVGCTGLTSINIPSSVIYIQNYAFWRCSNLTSIYSYGVTPVDLSSSLGVFLNIDKTACTLYVPFGTSALYAAADQWKDFLSIAEVPYPGSIAANQTICSGMIPAPLTSTIAGAGLGTISYRWEYSYDGLSWLPTGTSTETYAPGALTQTAIFRRVTISTVNETSWESLPTEPVTVTVTPDNMITLSSAVGTDAQTLCANTAITNITYTTTGATGATYSGLPDGVTGTWASNMVTISGIPLSSGTFNYTVTLTGCGITTKTGSIVVDVFTPTVTISASQNNVNAGTPVTFTATPVDGGTSPTYKWFLNNVERATGATGTYVPKNGDIIYAQMTSSLACSSGSTATSNSITMVVNQAVVASVSISVSENNVCAGTPVTYLATPIGGGTKPTYVWYLNNVASATGVSGTYVPTNGDVGYVVMTSSLPNVTGSPAKSNVITMVVDSPAALPDYFTEGKAYVTPELSDVRYTVPYVANMNYIWSYTGTGATIKGTSNSVLISFSGTATSGTLSVKASNSCGTSDPRSGNITVGNTLKAGLISDVVDHVDLPSAKSELKVYPNPASGPVNFEFQINQDAKATLDLSSITGQSIARIFDAEVEAGITQTIIYSEPLPAGVYLYALRWKDQIITGKLIITK